MRPEAANTQLEAAKEYLGDDPSTSLPLYRRREKLTPWQLFTELLELQPE